MSTYTPIASITLSSAQSSVTFSGIPQTYTDLVLIANITGVSVATDPWIRINGDTASNYSWTWFSGNGGTTYSERGSNNSKLYYSAITTIQNNLQQVVWNFMNYSSTVTNKTILWRESDAGTETGATVGLWRSTSAINSIEISLDSSRTYSAGTTFNLYGIDASLSEQAKATGGTSIYRDSSYWYHIFTSSGTFTPSQSISNVDYLVVAGGGGGGVSAGGGGGGGGLRSTVTATGGGGVLESKLLLSAQAYTITVGAGGAASSPGVQATQGGNSTFSTITSIGGGKGGAGGNGGTGGSGGGGEWQSDGAAGTAGQGYAGANGSKSGPPYKGGGGGGAGAAGSTPNGGNGVSVSILGSSNSYAGGGGGGSTDNNSGSGGSGGGGTGGTGSAGATAGTVNTGGGAGGSGGTNATASGGSGIVIIRYPV